MLFIDDKAYKLNDVKFNIPQKNKKDDFMNLIVKEKKIMSELNSLKETFDVKKIS